MKIEAFSEGKNLDAPEANEDQFLVLPERGYAVFDGATDNTGRLYDGKRGGWHASRIAMQAVGEYMLEPAERELRPERLIERISTAMRAAYARHGILDVARTDHAYRFGATLTLARDAGLLAGRRYTAHFSVAAELPDILAEEKIVTDGKTLQGLELQRCHRVFAFLYSQILAHGRVFGDFQMIHHLDHVFGHLRSIPGRIVWLLAFAMAAAIHCHHAKARFCNG